MSETPRLLADEDRERLRHLRTLGLEMRCFYDVGASNGRWSGQVSLDFPEANFELFEPLVDHVPAYQEYMEAALAKNPRFHLHKAALGARCGRTTFFMHKNPVGSTGLDLGSGASANYNPLEVETLTIDHAVKVLGRPKPQVIKIDTQGCELNILKGAQQTLPQVDVLLLECWLARGYGPVTPLLDEVSAWLRNFGFHLWDFAGFWRDKDGTLVSQDCFFLNARSPVSRLKEDAAFREILSRERGAPGGPKTGLFKRLASIGRSH